MATFKRGVGIQPALVLGDDGKQPKGETEMTTKQADRLIRIGVKVRLRNTHFQEEFIATLIGRNRRDVWTKEGGLFSRDELEVIEELSN